MPMVSFLPMDCVSTRRRINIGFGSAWRAALPKLETGTLALTALTLLGGCSVSVSTSTESGNGPMAVARAFLERVGSEGTAAAYVSAAPQMRAAFRPNGFRATWIRHRAG